jgi:pimeloyl-ACP methyl ester carboxylesterase
MNAPISTIRRGGGVVTKTAAADPDRDTFVPVAPRARRTVVSADGTRLQVYEFGVADGPAVVLVHGWTCSADFWTLQIRALAGEARLIVYDQRGHGRSGMPGPAGYTADALADDLGTVLDACVPDGTRAVVVGHSMGAMAVIACASRNAGVVRARVHAAVLASTGVQDLVPSAALLNLPRTFDPVFKPLARLALAAPLPLGRPTPLSHRFIRFVALSGSATPAQVRFCERIILGCRGTVRGRFAAAMTRFNLLDAVPALTVPTSVVVGTADRLTPPSHTRTITAALPNLVDRRELPRIGHMTPIEAADIVTTMIRDALATPSAHPPPPVPTPTVAG